ncbi:acetylxylan esterase [Verrucomicrobiales bacterium BCK34]|nr:acetylxylan esterase [Verrucomicrobiales bacterium BCK34]
MARIPHKLSFDPSYGYSLESLLALSAPADPVDFDTFWQSRREQAMKVAPAPRLEPPEIPTPKGWVGKTVRYTSTGGLEPGGRLLWPEKGTPNRALIFGHGYGAPEAEPYPDFLPPDTILFFPHARGLGLSRTRGISSNPAFHVLHGIQSRDTYLHGGCVDDLWLSVSALLELFPAVENRIGYCGISFGGGIGALALPWEPRISRAHFNVPSFGNHPLRLTMKTLGSGEAVRRYARTHDPEALLYTLSYFDAAVAARRLKIPVHAALALFDPFVTPAGQFSIYNAISSEKNLFVLDAGHFEYAGQADQVRALQEELMNFFQD